MCSVLPRNTSPWLWFNASLRFVLAQARENDKGIIWENINGRVGEINLGYGRGISGIGYMMWLGYKMNQRAQGAW